MRLAAATLLLAALATPALAQESRVRVELELGASFQTRNDVRVRGDTGTRFDLNALQGGPAAPLVRATVDVQPWERHGFRFAYQMLRSEGTGPLGQPTQFQNAVFAPGVATEGAYRFDTWRATYRYRLWQGETTRLDVGLTLLVRDAEIRLRQGGLTQRKTDIGVVPLLHVAAEWRPTPRLRLIAEVDALGASQGYAVDAALRGAIAINRSWEATISYRFLDGGADNSRVFNFAQFHSVTAGLAYRF
jgi:hypothetical protein